MYARNFARCASALLFCLIATSVVDAQFISPPNNATLTTREIPLPSQSMGRVQNSLLQLFQGSARATTNAPNRVDLQLAGGMASVEFLPSNQSCTVVAPKPLANDIASLIQSVAKTDGLGLRVLPLNDNGQASLAQALPDPFASLANQRTNPNARGGDGFKFSLPSFSGNRLTQLTSMQQDPNSANPSGQTTPTNANPPTSSPPPQNTKDNTLPLPQFDGVQIEMLPEIDAIILRGRDQQLSDLTEIIKRLDEASRLVKPEIEVIPLAHANSKSLADLITKQQETLVGSRQGRVNITSLGSPNAVLLIGWGEAMNAAKELVLKLDLPAPADSQFAVIQLKYANASDVQTQMLGFFRNRDGLGPVIQSMVDNRSNAIVVHASPRDLEQVRSLIAQLDVPRGANVHQARVFPIHHSLAADIAKALQAAIVGSSNRPNPSVQLLDQDGRPIVTSGILESSQITVNDRNNTIIVSSLPENLPLIEKLIEQLDTPGQVAKIKIFPIKNGDAGAMVETLRSLLSSANAGTAASPQLSNAPGDDSLVPLRFTVDARGNNVIAVGPDGDLKIVEALIFRLDESDSMQRKSTVYQLKNSPAVDVALAINEFLRNKRQVEIAAPGANNPFEQLEKEVVVVPEPVQNKLILSATPRYYDEIAKLIEQLDQQPPQVMIQVMIAEITLGNTDEFGMELGFQDSVLFDRSLLGGLLTRTSTTNTSTPAGVVTETTQDIVAATNDPGFNFNSTDPLGNSGSGKALSRSSKVGGQGISNFSVGRMNKDLGFGGLVLSASSESVSFLLRALQDSRRLEILSRPQVLTLDNQQAFIQVGQRVPRIVNSTINQNGAQNSVALENVGLIIGVTPRISPEGNVVMEIDAEKSKLGPETEGIPVSISNNGTVIRSPRVDTITAQATVSAADGETIILGGLISRSTRTQHRQVPWLGSLPVLKYLFSYDFNESLRSELLIIMTPHVVRSQGDMERLKQAEFARMSWCEADVFEVHGDVYPPTDLTSDMIQHQPWSVVYPDDDPRGQQLRESAAEDTERVNSVPFQQPPVGSAPEANSSDNQPATGMPRLTPPQDRQPPIGDPVQPSNLPISYSRVVTASGQAPTPTQPGPNFVSGVTGVAPTMGQTATANLNPTALPGSNLNRVGETRPPVASGTSNYRPDTRGPRR